MSFWSSSKRPTSIVLLLCGRLQELVLVSDPFQLSTFFRISEVVAYESFEELLDCINTGSTPL